MLPGGDHEQQALVLFQDASPSWRGGSGAWSKARPEQQDRGCGQQGRHGTVDALVLQLAQGLLRFSAAGLTGTLRCRVDLPAVERGRDFLRSWLTIVQSSEVEAVTGLDRYQFARQFHAVYGTSPYRYSLMQRLDVARGWLRDTRPLAETALDAGFADQAHFTRTFKAAFGMTPGRYVKLCAARAGDGAARPAGQEATQRHAPIRRSGAMVRWPR
jgi:AraC-like DNA-binding protein